MREKPKVSVPFAHDSWSMDRFIEALNQSYAGEIVWLRTQERCLIEHFVVHTMEFLLVNLETLAPDSAYSWDLKSFCS